MENKKKNIHLTDRQKHDLKMYYLGRRSNANKAAFLMAERLRLAGLIPDDGLRYPEDAGPRKHFARKTPQWVFIQATRIALFTTLIPEAERIMGQNVTLEPIVRHALFNRLGLTRGKNYALVAPKLTEEMADELLDIRDAGKFPRFGLHPWFPQDRFTKEFKRRAYAYPPPEYDKYFPEEWYDKYARDFEDVDGSLQAIPWDFRWNSQLLLPKGRKPRTSDPAASESTSNDETIMNTHKQTIESLFED